MKTIRTTLPAVVTALLAVVTAAPAVAGGWALVKLDEVPSGVAAGQRVTIGFTVLQHGRTPAGPEVLQDPAVLTARNIDDPAAAPLTATARPQGARGHYVVDVTFPTAGSWHWEVRPGWFEATTLTPLAVGPTAVAPTTRQPGATAGDRDGGVRPLTLVGGVLVVLAGGLALAAVRRPRPARVSTGAGPALTSDR
jgi:hypothetical protein